MPKYFVYIIQSSKDSTLYKGFTTDYIKRLENHNLGLSRYTSRKCPWHLVYVERHDTRAGALMRERSLKRANSNYLKWLLTQPSNILNQRV